MFSTVVILLVWAQLAPPEPAEIEASIRKARNNITMAYLDIRATLREEKDGEQFSRSYRIWLDGERLRTDAVQPVLPDHRMMRSVDCWNCEERGTYFHYNDTKHNGKQLGSSFTHITAEQLAAGKRIAVIDPKKIGIIPDGPLAYPEYASFDYLFVRPDRRYLPVAIEELNGIKCFRLEYTSGIFRVRYWVDYEESHVCYKVEELTKGGIRTRVLTNTFANAELRKFGIPSMFAFDEKLPGSYFTETCTVVEGSINQPLPPDTFKVNGFNLAEGTIVAGVPPNGGLYVASAAEIVPYNSWKVEQEVAKIEQEQGAQWRRERIRIAAVVGSISLLIVSFCLYRFVYVPRKRRRQEVKI